MKHKAKIRRRESEGAVPAHKDQNCLRNYDWPKLVIITVLAAAPYIPCLDGEFVFDDSATIINNPVVTGKIPLKQVFTTDYWGHPIASPQSHKSYRPLTTLTYWFNYRIHGEWTLPYHLINIAFHAFASVLVFHLVKSLRYATGQSLIHDEAFVAAALFAVHPVHTEAISKVANVTGRAELLMGIFMLLVLVYYQKKIRKGFNEKAIILFFVLVILSVFSKEQGITILPVCVFLEVLHCLPTERRYAAATLRCFMLFCYALILISLRCYINDFTSPNSTELDNPAPFVKNPLLRMASYSYLWLINFRLLLLPYSLCFDYSMGCIPPITNWSAYRILSLPAMVLLMIALICILYKVNDRLCTFGAALGIISFLPASNLLVTVGFTVAERVLYLPSVGWCIMVAVVYVRASRYYHNLDKVGLAVLMIAIKMIYQRSEEWRTELDLYASGLRACPENAKIHYNLGKVLSKIGNVDAAEHNYWNAMLLNPNYEHALNNLANILESKGRSAVTFQVGTCLGKNGSFVEAERHFKRVLQLSPSNAMYHANLGVLYQRWARYGLAEYHYRKALSLERIESVELNLKAIQQNRTISDVGRKDVTGPVEHLAFH